MSIKTKPLTREEVLLLVEEGKKCREDFSKKIRIMESREPRTLEVSTPKIKKSFMTLTLSMADKKHIDALAVILLQVEEKIKIIEDDTLIQLVYCDNLTTKAAVLAYLYDKKIYYSLGESEIDGEIKYNYF